MTYETTPINVKESAKRAVKPSAVLSHYGTPTIIWHLVKRHKVALLIFGNAVFATLYFFPFVPGIIGEFIAGL